MMSEIYLPEDDDQEQKTEISTEQVKLDITYKATADDEKAFFLINYMNIQPSEIGFDLTDPERRDWLMARFIMQQNMEREQMIQQQMMSNLDLNKLKI